MFGRCLGDVIALQVRFGVLARPRRRYVALALAGLAAGLSVAPATVAHAEPRVTLAPASGPAGELVSVTGSGFRRARALRVRAGSRTLARPRASKAGGFSTSVAIPSGRKRFLLV